MDNKLNKRIEKCNNISEKMKNDGYTRRDLTTTALRAQTICYLLPLPFVVMYAVIYFLLGNSLSFEGEKPILIIVLTAITLIIHEGLHALGHSIFAKNHFKDVEFGFSKGCPYCYCNACETFYHYAIALLMPLIVLGISLSIISFFLHSTVFFLVVVINIFGTSGDIEILRLMIKDRKNGKDALYHDHPELPGVIKFYK